MLFIFPGLIILQQLFSVQDQDLLQTVNVLYLLTIYHVLKSVPN